MTRSGVAVALLLAACGAAESTSRGEQVVVFAAASLTDAFEEIAEVYEDATGVRLVVSFDASSALRAQIEQGAPAGLFASADRESAEAIVDGGLAADDARTFATNALALVVPAGGQSPVEKWQDLADPGVRIIGAGESVPITRYAADLVARLARDPSAPDAFAESVAANVVSREDNVRAVLAKVELGEGDAALVYETDAIGAEDVDVIALPDASNVSAEYVMVLVAEDDPAAAELARWLLESEAQAILAEHGFRPPDE